MNIELFLDILKDALKDSLLIFFFVFLVYFILAYVEEGFSHFLTSRKKSAPLFGALFGLMPQCGTSVLGSDLYIRKSITIGTLIAIFLSCSDEAFILMLTTANSRTIMILPLMGLKFIIGFIIGFSVDIIFKTSNQLEEYHEDHKCHQHHEDNTLAHKYFIHPLMHSLEIFIYVLVINIVLGLIIGSVGQDNFALFLTSNKYLTPLYSCIIGLIPNCSSSLLITELFMSGHIPFGSLLSGLLVNSGLGMMILLKNKKHAKNILLIISICFLTAIISGYLTCLIAGF